MLYYDRVMRVKSKHSHAWIKPILGIVAILAGIVVLFSSEISSFIYNLYEPQFLKNLIIADKEATVTDELISRKINISESWPTDLNDINILKDEVLRHLNILKDTSNSIDKIIILQSRIPLFNKQLKDYHAAKVVWGKDFKEWIGDFSWMKDTEYRIYDLAAKLDLARSMVYPPEPMDGAKWTSNCKNAIESVKNTRIELGKADQEKLLTTTYRDYLENYASHIDFMAKLNLQALEGDITWDEWKNDIGTKKSPIEGETNETVLAKSEAWRKEIIAPMEEKKNAAFERKNRSIAVLVKMMEDKIPLNDPITIFLADKGLLKVPEMRYSVQQAKILEKMLPSELKMLEALRSDEDFSFLKKVFTAYLSNDKSICIRKEALEKKEDEIKLWGLDMFDDAYYRSNFTPILKTPIDENHSEIKIIFTDKPDRLFTANIEIINAGKCITTFFVDSRDAENVKMILDKYSDIILNPKFSI